MKRFNVAMILVIALFAAAFAVYFQVSGHQHVMKESKSDGPLANATVSFGGWMTNIPLDRFPNDASTQFPITRNHHALTPTIAKIKAGGTVNFIIGGFHVVTVYDDGTQPGDIDKTLLTTVANPPGPPIINDPNRRIYRGLDPSVLPAKSAQDRVEVVHFDRPGTYLVICSVLPHFNDGMFGFVKVLPRGDDDD